MEKTIWVPLLLIFTLTQFSIIAQDGLNDNTSLKYLKSNLYFLASDQLEGRETTSRGEQISSLFIASELEKYGVQPFGDSGTYFQNFPVIETKFGNENSLTIFSDNSEKTTEAGDNFILIKFILPDNKYSNNKYDLAFAGFGLTSEESDYDDYKNIDVTNKIVIIKSGIPTLYGASPFSENEIAKFKKGNYKIKIAEEHGAVGCLVIPDSSTKKYWKYIAASSKSASLKLEYEDDTSELSIPIALISDEFAQELLNNEKQSFSEIEEKIRAEEPTESFLLTKKILLRYDLQTNIKYARNVLGVLPGNNDDLKDQIVSVGAHFDHEGVLDGEIYNGADDDGSGTVAILETARKLSIIKDNERPILFIFHTGEEKGLLGSSYLTDNSPFVKNIISNINIDMVGRESEDSIYCIGSKMLSTELSQLLEETNEETVHFILNYKFDDPNDPNKYYYRSDHYNYAKKGIPIAFFYDHMTLDYHKPTDTPDKIDYYKINKISKLVTNLALKISNLDHKLVVDKVVESESTN